MAMMTDAERAAFLAVTRLGMLSTLAVDGAPVTVPVWFDWDGAALHMFSSAGTGKVRRLTRDSRATLLVPNAVGEPEAWVAFDGDVSIAAEGAFALAERLAHRYWDMDDAARKVELESWRAGAAHLRLLELRPRSIRTSKG
jgi:PPOX class probable F420-dependent enzyme